jgi:hypothetical protein
MLAAQRAAPTNVPGRTTEVKDSEWICRLVRHWLVRPSFVPPPEIRRLCDLTRLRKAQIRARPLDPAAREGAPKRQVKLTSLASQAYSKSARAMLDAVARRGHRPRPAHRAGEGQDALEDPQLREALANRCDLAHGGMVAQRLGTGSCRSGRAPSKRWQPFRADRARGIGQRSSSGEAHSVPVALLPAASRRVHHGSASATTRGDTRPPDAMLNPSFCRDFSTARAHADPPFTRRGTTHNREVGGSNPPGAIRRNPYPFGPRPGGGDGRPVDIIGGCRERVELGGMGRAEAEAIYDSGREACVEIMVELTAVTSAGSAVSRPGSSGSRSS